MTKIPCHVSQEQGAEFGSLLLRKNYHLINHHNIGDRYGTNESKRSRLSDRTN